MLLQVEKCPFFRPHSIPYMVIYRCFRARPVFLWKDRLVFESVHSKKWKRIRVFFFFDYFFHFVSMFHRYETRKLRHYRIFFAQVDDVRLPGAFDNLKKKRIIIFYYFFYFYFVFHSVCRKASLFPIANQSASSQLMKNLKRKKNKVFF